MRLFLLRHGVPVEPESWVGSDRTRPLTDAGREETSLVLQAISTEARGKIEEIWASPYLRTDQTARIASAILGAPCRSVPGLASGSRLLRTLGPLPLPEGLLLVGHQPDLGNLVTELTGSFASSHSFARAGMARLEGDFRGGGMKLLWLKSPSDILRPPP